MRTFKNYLSYVAVFALLFTASCSKDDPTVDNKLTPDTSTLSFATVLNDLVASKANLKQSLEDLPACSPGVPSHVEVVLSGTETVGTMAAPIVVNVSPNPGDYDGDGQVEYFTEEASELELDPGPYSLDFFAVYDSSNTLLWVAPASGSFLGNLVENPLPLDIDLAAGTKKYVDVDVLCFDDRVVNEYGYLFFDIENKKAIEFCFFANVCDDNGRHFPAHYSVDVWLGTDNTGKVLYSDKMNSVSEQGEDPSAAPLCLALPDLEEFEDAEDYIYYEVTLLDWANVYGDVDQVVKKGTLSRDDIEANFAADGTVNFEHLRFGCDSETPTIDADTSIYIYFDSSGSMNTTLNPLVTMRNTLLKDALLPLYNNDEAIYNERVKVISNPTERTLDFLNIQNETPSGNVISLVFQDESQYVYTPGGWAVNGPRTAQFDTDLGVLRSRLNSFPTNYYSGIIFQVGTANFGQFAQFRELIKAIENGTGSYSGTNGLSDRTEFGYEYDVTPGASPDYYKDLIVNALRNLGYAL